MIICIYVVFCNKTQKWAYGFFKSSLEVVNFTLMSSYELHEQTECTKRKKFYVLPYLIQYQIQKSFCNLAKLKNSNSISRNPKFTLITFEILKL